MARIRVAAGMVAVVAMLAGAAGQAVAADKRFSVDLSPTTSTANTDQEFNARITNLDSQQTLGSVNLGAPDGFVVKSATVLGTGTATTDGSTVFVRNLSLPGSDANGVDVRMVVDTTAVTGVWQWSAAGKQANDFRGTGNDFVLDLLRSNLTTVITAGSGGKTVDCPDEPTGGGTETCKVEVTHRGIFNGSVFTMTVLVTANPELPGNAGTLSLLLPSPRNIQCPGLAFSTPVSLLTNGPLGRAKVVRFTVDGALPGHGNDVCYAAPYPFATTSPGTPFLEGSSLFFVGGLLDCAPALDLLTPCVAMRDYVDGNYVYEVRVPATLPDPYIRG